MLLYVCIRIWWYAKSEVRENEIFFLAGRRRENVQLEDMAMGHNVMNDFMEIGCKNRRCMQLAQDCVQWQDCELAGLNLQVLLPVKFV
jgi:hypothetical protein